MNNRHQQFLDEYLANGMNGTQAYKKVYPKVKDNTARINANKLLTRTDIAEELKKRQEATANRLQITKEDLIRDLIDIKNDTKTDDRQRQTAIKAIEVLNKMLGFNEPEKTDVTSNGNQITRFEINIKKPLND